MGAGLAGTAEAMWGGRFGDLSEGEAADAAVFRAINDSLPVDWRIVREDIAGSVAWAEGIHRAGVISDDELTALVRALADVWAEASSLASPPIESGAEDVHTWVEQRVTAVLDERGHAGLGKKLHTGRSRNDQVATDLRLWTLGAVAGLRGLVGEVRALLAEAAARDADLAMPAYTHLQVAQPVTAGHWALAYAEMLGRDDERLAQAAGRADRCPLGCGALAGTTYAVDREAIAARLGFGGICTNSLDAVSGRDFVVDVLSACAMCGLHLSRMAEDIIVYASAEFGLVQLPDSVCSGSSLMPQKKNPDGPECVRGKAGRLFAELSGLMVTLKGLPLAYNKDLQDDKRALFAAVDELSLMLRVTAATVRGMRFDRERCAAAAMAGGSNATELADYLVEKGVPFREAHGVVGRAVRRSIELGRGLEAMTAAELAEVDGRIGADCGPWLSLGSMLSRRDQPGGTSPERVREAAAAVVIAGVEAHAVDPAELAARVIASIGGGG